MHLDTSPRPPSFGHAAGIGTGTENGSVEKNTSRHSARQVEACRKRRHSARFFQPNHGHFMRPFVSWISAGSTVQPTSASKTLASGVNRVYIIISQIFRDSHAQLPSDPSEAPRLDIQMPWTACAMSCNCRLPGTLHSDAWHCQYFTHVTYLQIFQSWKSNQKLQCYRDDVLQ